QGTIGDGYMIYKELSESDNGKKGEEYRWTEVTTKEYHNYSNKGVLYFGGGVKEEAAGGGNENEWSEETVNGTIRFNGTYNGTIEYQNFKYRRETRNFGNDRSYSYISGTVKIGTFDITKKYFETVIKKVEGESGGNEGEPIAGYAVLFDDFNMKETGFISQNSLSKGNLVGGFWYFWTWNGPRVTSHDGVELSDIENDDNYDKFVDLCWGDGNLNAVIDSRGLTGYDWGAGVECTFFGDENLTVNLSGLKSIKIKGKLQGTIYLSLLKTPYYDEEGWAWKINGGSSAMENFDKTLDATENDMIGDWGSNKGTENLSAYLAQVTGLRISPDYSGDGDYASFSIDEIYLIFNDESSVPSEFK
ncbi:MAG: hypothetical protein FWF51_11660, partial [Chitinivibrionia bacterium]|nr:hypothetical protein [Chitinivibrionia bacterium]